MKILTNQKVARYIAAPMVGIGVLSGAALGFAGVAGAATGEPGTSQTTNSEVSNVFSITRNTAAAPSLAGFGGTAA